MLRAQEERLQAKVEEELRLAGAGAGARCVRWWDTCAVEKLAARSR